MAARVPYYHLEVEGKDITSWVDSVSAVEDDREADSVAITIPDPRMIYADALMEGATVTLDMGYAAQGQHALILRAVITKVEVNYPDNGTPRLTLKGQDRSILMGLREKRRRWRDLSVTDIVRKIAGENGFTRVQATLHPDPVRERPVVQDGKTDLAFLQDLAKHYHARCFVELNENGQEVLYFIPERKVVSINRPEQLVLRYRMGPNSNLISFSPGFDSSYIDRLKEAHDVDRHGHAVQSQDPGPVQEVEWTLDDQRLALASKDDTATIRHLFAKGMAGKKRLAAQLHARRPAVGEVVLDQADLEPASRTLESQRLGMTATGTTFGNIWLRAKSNVTIQGSNARFDGAWYVTRVTNRIDANGFKTEFKCVR